MMTDVDLSLCIVSLQARDYLRDCLISIAEATSQISYEIIVVDQNSQDGTVEMIRDDFPHVKLIESAENDGFVGGSNRAMRAGQGRYLALLNPDTIVLPGSLELLCAFLDSHPDVGIVGPKVLNPDGTLQGPCRRGDARPWAVISYFSGLGKLFPDKAIFNGYLLTHLDEDKSYPVDGVSGSCMLIRREVVEKISYLDEDIFSYQEDADYCLRTRNAGWQVYYYPEAKIIHHGGQGGSQVEPVRSIIAWHKSYFYYFRKHFASDYFFVLNWLYYAAMGVKLLLALAKNFLAKDAFGGSRKPG
jgi:GT2 family glycosyltransferase